MRVFSERVCECMLDALNCEFSRTNRDGRRVTIALLNIYEKAGVLLLLRARAGAQQEV